MPALQPNPIAAYTALRHALEQRGVTVAEVGWDDPLVVPLTHEAESSLNQRHAFASYYRAENPVLGVSETIYIGIGPGNRSTSKPPGWQPDAHERLQSLLHEAVHKLQNDSPLSGFFLSRRIPLLGTLTNDGFYATDGRSASEVSAILSEALAYETITGRPGDYPKQVVDLAVQLPEFMTTFIAASAVQLVVWATGADWSVAQGHMVRAFTTRLAHTEEAA